MPKTLRFAALAVLALGLVVAPPLLAQESDADIRKEIQALKEGQQRLQKQLNDIKRLLQQQRQPSRPRGPEVEGKTFDITSGRIKGERSAPLTLIEFTDYQ